MKLYAIGIYNRQGQPQALAYEKTLLGIKISADIEKTIIAKLTNTDVPADIVYKISTNQTFYYLTVHGQFIYILASPDEMDVNNELTDQFDDLKNLSPSDYSKLNIKIANPNKYLSRLKIAEAEVVESQKLMIRNIDKILERGERIEVLLEKTDMMVENNFRLPAIKKPRKTSDTCLNTLYSFFCCLPQIKPKNEWELSEPLLSTYRDGRKY